MTAPATGDIELTPVFYANQHAYNLRSYRVIANEGSTRSSKTFSIAQLLITILTTEKNREISVCSPSLPHLKRGARKDILDELKRWGIYNDKHFNKTDNKYTYPGTGSYIEFFGVEDIGKVHGPGRNILYINEANLIDVKIYTQLAIRTTDVIFIDYNPADEFSWVYTVADKPGNKIIHSTWRNNKKFLTQAQIDEILGLQEADENLWKVYGLGLRGTSTETIYTHWKQVDHFPQCNDVFYGLDFGYNHPSALVKCGETDNARYAEEILYESKLTPEDLADVVKILGVGSLPVYCDSARPDAIEVLQRRGINALLAEKSVWDGIQAVKSRPLYIVKSSINLIKEIKSYKWMVDKKTGRVLEVPVKFRDDAMDAMRYGFFTHTHNPIKPFADAIYE
jgi:phage terminase large subunit